MSDRHLRRAVASLIDCNRRLIWAIQSGDHSYVDEAKEKLDAAERQLEKSPPSIHVKVDTGAEEMFRRQNPST